MKKTVFAMAVATLLGTSAVMAADVTGPTPYNWSGVYLGINGGFGFGSNNWNHDSGIPSDDGSFSGALGGVTLGANWQTSGVVLGIEGDADIAGINARDPQGAFGCGGGFCDTSVNSLATARLRVGYDIGSGAMIFATGGLAGGHVEAHNDLGADYTSATKIGWTAGAGLEAALSSNVSVKLEGLYVDLGRLDGFPACATNCYTDVHFAVARVGLNYKF